MSSCFAMKHTRMFNLIDSQRESFPAYIAIILGTGLGFLGCIALNKVLNHTVLSTCNRNINQVVYIKTAVGDSYGCVSKMVLSGPPAPIKP
jgi:hypothetical protein